MDQIQLSLKTLVRLTWSGYCWSALDYGHFIFTVPPYKCLSLPPQEESITLSGSPKEALLSFTVSFPFVWLLEMLRRKLWTLSSWVHSISNTCHSKLLFFLKCLKYYLALLSSFSFNLRWIQEKPIWMRFHLGSQLFSVISLLTSLSNGGSIRLEVEGDALTALI